MSKRLDLYLTKVSYPLDASVIARLYTKITGRQVPDDELRAMQASIDAVGAQPNESPRPSGDADQTNKEVGK